MKDLLEIRKELVELKKGVYGLAWIYHLLPESLTQIDYEEILDEVKYLCGYVDCMMNFNIELPIKCSIMETL